VDRDAKKVRLRLSALTVFRLVMSFSWSGGRDSNPRQPAWEAGSGHAIAYGRVSKSAIWSRFLTSLIYGVLSYTAVCQPVWQQSWQHWQQ
jgi:hypothetical protein